MKTEATIKPETELPSEPQVRSSELLSGWVKTTKELPPELKVVLCAWGYREKKAMRRGIEWWEMPIGRPIRQPDKWQKPDNNRI